MSGDGWVFGLLLGLVGIRAAVEVYAVCLEWQIRREARRQKEESL